MWPGVGVVPVTVLVKLAVVFVLAFGEVVVTLAVFVIVPAMVGVTTIVMVSVAPAAKLPIESVTTPLTGVSIAPLVVSVAETKVTPPGSISVTTTPLAANEPLLVTVIV